jgi:hypothetical protein
MADEKTVIDHPSYYNQYSVEAVDMARKIWGEEALATAAEITAFFYRMRAGHKEDVEFETDLQKEEWWLNKAKEVREANVEE